MTTQNEQRSQDQDRNIWWSLLGGIVVWSVHLMLVYPLTSLNCERGLLSGTIAGLSMLQFVQTVATILAALLVTSLGFLSLREWRRSRRESEGFLASTADARRPLMAFVATVLNAFFLLSILMSFVPVFVLSSCA